MFKQEKGITLIALVITIIVLLILAGITIAMLTGSDNAPDKAAKASAETKIAEAKEQASIDIVSAYADYMEFKFKDYPSYTGTFKDYLGGVAANTVQSNTAVAAFATSNADLYTIALDSNKYVITIVPKTQDNKTVTGDVTAGGSVDWKAAQ